MRGKSAVLVSLVAVVVAIPAIVYASHTFNDVSFSHTFHSDIDWLAANGVTQGCNPPANSEFCPDESVTRGQMAAFMKRFHDRFIDTAGSETIGLAFASRSQSATPFSGNGVVAGLSLAVDIPESGALFISSSADTFASTVDIFSCGINVGGTPASALPNSWRTVDLSANFADTCTTETAIPVTAGERTIRLVISGANASTQVGAATMSLVLYTNSGFVGLLGEMPDEVEAPDIPDTPKGG
jgi:hypothetical protein